MSWEGVKDIRLIRNDIKGDDKWNKIRHQE